MQPILHSPGIPARVEDKRAPPRVSARRSFSSYSVLSCLSFFILGLGPTGLCDCDIVTFRPTINRDPPLGLFFVTCRFSHDLLGSKRILTLPAEESEPLSSFPLFRQTPCGGQTEPSLASLCLCSLRPDSVQPSCSRLALMHAVQCNSLATPPRAWHADCRPRSTVTVITI